MGMVEPGMDQPTWFKMEKGVKYFVPTLDKFLMLDRCIDHHRLLLALNLLSIDNRELDVFTHHD